MCRLTTSSPQNTRASEPSRRRNRFSAKLRRASGNHLAPGICSLSERICVPLWSAMTPEKSHTNDQKYSGFSTDHSSSSWYVVSVNPYRVLATCINFAVPLCAESDEGLHNGLI